MFEWLQEVGAGKFDDTSERLLPLHHGPVAVVFEFCPQLKKHKGKQNWEDYRTEQFMFALRQQVVSSILIFQYCPTFTEHTLNTSMCEVTL